MSGRVLLVALGSLGSVHPYLAVASGLKCHGFSVAIASAESQRTLIERAGFDFHAVRPDRDAVLRRQAAGDSPSQGGRRSSSSIQNLLRYAEQSYDDLLAACRGVDLLVSHPGAFTAPLVAEKLKLCWVSVALAPATLFSACDPPVLPYAPWLARVPRYRDFPHSLLFRAFQAVTRKWMRPLDELRERVGLPPAKAHPLFRGMFSPFGTLGWFSPLLASPQPDWPPRTRITGFPFGGSEILGECVPAGLEEFLAAGDPPVVFTLGSNMVREAGNFYVESLEAVRRIGCRAVLLVGAEARNRPARAVPPNVFIADYVPHANVFPRTAMVVHQGGISTTAQAMRAGLPMLIVPHTHDQPDNAYRASRLGVARVEAAASYTADRAARHLRALLGERSPYAEAARSIADRLRGENGVAVACEAVEDILRHA